MKTRQRSRRIKKASSARKPASPPADTSLTGSAVGMASTRASLRTAITLAASATGQARTHTRMKVPKEIDPDDDTDPKSYLKEARRVFRQRNPAKRRGVKSSLPVVENACEQIWRGLSPKPRSVAQWVKQVQEITKKPNQEPLHEDTVKPKVQAWLLRQVPHDQLPPSLRKILTSK